MCSQSLPLPHERARWTCRWSFQVFSHTLCTDNPLFLVISHGLAPLTWMYIQSCTLNKYCFRYCTVHLPLFPIKISYTVQNKNWEAMGRTIQTSPNSKHRQWPEIIHLTHCFMEILQNVFYQEKEENQDREYSKQKIQYQRKTEAWITVKENPKTAARQFINRKGRGFLYLPRFPFQNKEF